MFYYLIFLICFPFLAILSPFRKNANKNLIIQTAKIGDYVNTSIMLDVLKNSDVIIDNINYDFANNDSRIIQIFIINKYKKNLLKKLQLGFVIFFRNYQNIYIVMPNSYNLFLGQMGFTKNTRTLSTYADKWYSPILSFGIKKIKHTKENLTINSYVKLINKGYSHTQFNKIIQYPIVCPKNSYIKQNKFNVGISLTAGNKLKTIDLQTWQKIITILYKFDINLYIFGTEDEISLYKKFSKSIQSTNIIYSLLGKVKLKFLPSEIKKIHLYISSDTGNSYIADSMNIPVINFAGPCYMKEQKPTNNALIIKSNAECTPFSYIFDAPYVNKCDNLYVINQEQEQEIYSFISNIYKSYKSQISI